MKTLLSLGVVSLLVGIAAMTLSAGQDRGTNDGIQDRFVGAWRLASLETQSADGKTHRADSTGLLVFTRDGHMSVQVMERNPHSQTTKQTSAEPEQYSQGGYEACARRASSARSVRLLARRVSSISSEFDNVMASLMDAIIVYKWLLQSTRPPLHVLRSDSSPPGGSPGASVRGSEPSGSRKKLAAKMGFSPGLPLRHHDHCVLWRSLEQPFNIYLSRSNKCKSANSGSVGMTL